MTPITIPLAPPDAEAFAPFGRLIVPPGTHGDRAHYGDMLDARPDGSAPVLHVNKVAPRSLPLSVTEVERHPHAAQCFVPLDVARYAVLVMPSDSAGLPRPEQALAMMVPGDMGVIFAPGVWHMGATVFDRDGHFTVLMWRGGPGADDEFREIPPVTLIAP